LILQHFTKKFNCRPYALLGDVNRRIVMKTEEGTAPLIYIRKGKFEERLPKNDLDDWSWFPFTVCPVKFAVVGSSKVGKKLYVGNLTFSVGDAELEDLFAPFGEVRSAQVVIDRQTGRSRGFGFVEMASDADAMAAIDALHDQEHGGRCLTVNEAKPRENRGGKVGGRNESFPSRP
jgi:hypothetical protein